MGEEVTRWGLVETDWSNPFNSPLECGLRSIVLLAEAYPKRLDLQRLLHYDYLLVHSGDVGGGPESIHPPTPHRSGELLVRRPLIEKGIMMMLSRSVIECEFTSRGILYFSGEWGVSFLDTLVSDYTRLLKERARWVVQHFSRYTDEELTRFVREHWGQWGSEFEFEAMVRGVDE